METIKGMGKARCCGLCKQWKPSCLFEINTTDIETGMSTTQEIKVCSDCRNDPQCEVEEK